MYTSADVGQMRETTGIEDVRPFAQLEEELSVALTDYRDWRITQIGRWPLPAALAKTWGRGRKTHFLRAINCGAITEAEALETTGLTVDELRSRSFARILQLKNVR